MLQQQIQRPRPVQEQQPEPVLHSQQAVVLTRVQIQIQEEEKTRCSLLEAVASCFIALKFRC